MALWATAWAIVLLLFLMEEVTGPGWLAYSFMRNLSCEPDTGQVASKFCKSSEPGPMEQNRLQSIDAGRKLILEGTVARILLQGFL